MGEVVKTYWHGDEDEAIRAPATTIYCFAWRYADGFQRFTLQEVMWLLDENKNLVKKQGNKFTAEYIDQEELEGRFLYFLSQHTEDLWKWNVWVEAFQSLCFGGPGVQFMPGWRFRQLTRKRKEMETHPSASTPT